MSLLETLQAFVRWLGGLALIGWTAAQLLTISPLGRDSTDEAGWFGDRSGALPVVDQMTGCEYLKAPGGGITPRMGRNGQQICREH